MPRRTNLFQQVILVIHEHAADGARVEESAMLPSASTGQMREVDVLIHVSGGPYPVLIGIEATARARPADLTWVEQMIAKHDDLPASKLVLVCEAGFTGPARRRAEGSHVAALTPEELDATDPAQAVLVQLTTLWPKHVTLNAHQAQLLLRAPDGSARAINDLDLDAAISTEDETTALTLGELLVTSAQQGGLLPLLHQLRQLDHDAQRAFYARDVEAPKIRRGKAIEPLFFTDDIARTRWLVERTAVGGVASVAVGEIPLTHRRLGEIAFAYGTGRVGEQELMAVINNGQLTLRSASSTAD